MRTSHTCGMLSFLSESRHGARTNQFPVTLFWSQGRQNRPRSGTTWMPRLAKRMRNPTWMKVSSHLRAFLGLPIPAIPVEPASGRKGNRKPWQPPRVKTLAEEDIDKYSIFDVVMPLPGNDVAFPGGALGQKYREYLIRDGLDPDN